MLIEPKKNVHQSQFSSKKWGRKKTAAGLSLIACVILGIIGTEVIRHSEKKEKETTLAFKVESLDKEQEQSELIAALAQLEENKRLLFIQDHRLEASKVTAIQNKLANEEKINLNLSSYMETMKSQMENYVERIKTLETSLTALLEMVEIQRETKESIKQKYQEQLDDLSFLAEKEKMQLHEQLHQMQDNYQRLEDSLSTNELASFQDLQKMHNELLKVQLEIDILTTQHELTEEQKHQLLLESQTLKNQLVFAEDEVKQHRLANQQLLESLVNLSEQVVDLNEQLTMASFLSQYQENQLSTLHEQATADYEKSVNHLHMQLEANITRAQFQEEKAKELSKALELAQATITETEHDLLSQSTHLEEILLAKNALLEEWSLKYDNLRKELAQREQELLLSKAQEISDWSFKYDSLKKELEQKDHELYALKAQEDGLHARYDSLAKELTQKEYELYQTKSQEGSWAAQYEALSKEFTKKEQELLFTKADEINAWSKKYDALVNEFAQREQELLLAKEEEVRNWPAKYDSLAKEFTRKEQELLLAKTEEINNWLSQYEALKNELSQKEQENLSAVTKERENWAAKFDALNKEYAEKEHALLFAKAEEIFDWSMKYEELAKELAQKEEEFHLAKTQNMEDHTSQYDSLVTAFAEKEQALQLAKAEEIFDWSVKYEELAKELAQKEETLQLAKAKEIEAWSTKYAMLEKELLAKSDEAGSMSGRYDMLTKEFSGKEQELKTWATKYEMLEKELLAKSDEVIHLSTRYDMFTKDFAEKEQALLAKHAQEMAGLTAQKEKLDHELQGALAFHAELSQSQELDWTSKYDQISYEYQKLKLNHEEMEMQYAYLLENHFNLASESSKLKEELLNHQEKLARMNEAFELQGIQNAAKIIQLEEEVRSQLMHLEVKNEQQKQEAEEQMIALNNERLSLSDELKKMESQIEDLKQSLSKN